MSHVLKGDRKVTMALSFSSNDAITCVLSKLDNAKGENGSFCSYGAYAFHKMRPILASNLLDTFYCSREKHYSL